MPNITENQIEFEASWGNKYDRGRQTRFILELSRSEMAAGMVLWGWTELKLNIEIATSEFGIPFNIGSCVVGPIRTSPDGSCKVTFIADLAQWTLTPYQQLSFDETLLYVTVAKLEEENEYE